MKKSEVLNLFHHLHHAEGEHMVHHCGGKHVKVDPAVDYTIKHCDCGLHSIDKEKAVGHATDSNLDSVDVELRFSEPCPFGGWHVESGGGLYKLNISMNEIKLNLDNFNKSIIDKIALYFLDDSVVAYPTDTVYGLGCVATNIKAIEKLNKIKKREVGKSYIVLIKELLYVA